MSSVQEAKVKRTVTGRVISNKMNKTVTVAVERQVAHPKYGKYVRKTTKLKVHDEQNQCQEGDLVEIQECRPISKMKAWKLVAVLEKAAG